MQAAQPATSEDTPPPQVVPPVATPPETSPQLTAETMPTATTAQPTASGGTPPPPGAPPVPGNPAKIVRKQVRKAQREFARKVLALMETESRGFYLRLCITLAYLWLKIGEKDAYVDEVLAKLHEQHKDAWAPSKTTLQHYEGPMLRWLAERARKKNPDDPNLSKKFTLVFLRQYPQYIVDAPLKELNRECKTLVSLDKKYGNGCVKPDEQKAELCAEGIAPVVKTEPSGSTTEPPQDSKPAGAENKRAQRSRLQNQARKPASAANGESTMPSKIGESEIHPSVPKASQTLAKAAGADPQRTQGCKLRNQPRQPASAADEEPSLPSNDDLLEKIHVVKQTLMDMKAAGIPINDDAKVAMANCCLLAKHINSYFGLPAPSRASTTTLRGISTPAQSPALPVTMNGNGSPTLVGSGSTVPESTPIGKANSQRPRAAKRPRP